MLSKVAPIRRFRDESIGGIRSGALTGEEPDETTLYYQSRIGGKVYSGIRVFHRLARFVTFFSVKERELLEEVNRNWEKVYEFVKSSPAFVEPYCPKRLTLVYGFADFGGLNYSAVFTPFGTFTFLETETEEAVKFGLPVRDLMGRDLEIARTLFLPTFHSYLSLKILNLLGE